MEHVEYQRILEKIVFLDSYDLKQLLIKYYLYGCTKVPWYTLMSSCTHCFLGHLGRHGVKTMVKII